MKSPLVQLLLLSVIMTLSLWAGVKWFLSSTYEHSSTLNSNSLSYHREAPASSSSASSKEPTSSASLLPATPAVYARPDSKAKAQDSAEQTEELLEEEAESESDTEENEEEETEAAEQELTEAEPEVVEFTAAEQIAVSETLAGTDKVSEAIEQAPEELQDEAIRLSDNELEERENARLKRLEELGLVTKKQPAPTIAIDASLDMPSSCAGAGISKVPVGLKFRYESSIIRGESLNALEALVALYRQCGDGEFVLAENPLGRQDATEALTQMRFDEVKYFFIQHSVSVDVVQFPEAK